MAGRKEASSWKIACEGAQNGTTRLTGGINDFAFRKTLAPGEHFDTPEAVFVYSDEGLGGLSRAFHDYARDLRIFQELVAAARQCSR